MDEALLKIKGPYTIKESGIVFPDGVTEEQKKVFPAYSVFIHSERVYLEFNYGKKLIENRYLGHPLVRKIENFFR